MSGPRPASLGRRGMVFLFASLLLVSVFLIIFFTRTLPTSDDKAESVVLRVVTLDDFLKNFHEDLHRATYISAYRSLIAIEQRFAETGAFMDDPEAAFKEAFLNGTVDGDAYDILQNSTFTDYLQRVQAEAQLLGLQLNATIENVSLNQSTPWSIDVALDVIVNATDERGTVRWDYRRQFVTEVTILDLRDPVYAVYTFGKVPNTFRRSPYNNSDFVDGNDTTNLNDEVVQMYYREDPHAPSFLQRLHGNLTGSSKYGIASLVDLDDLNVQGLLVHPSRSDVDYLYFSGVNMTEYCPGFGEPLPSWFRIDATHYGDAQHDYEVPLLNATVC